MDILRINIMALKCFLLWPIDWLSSISNNVLAFLQISIISISAVQTSSSIVYQFAIGIDDINIILEAIIAMADYIGFIYIYICFRVNVPKINKIIKRTRIFLQYCDMNIIQQAEEQVQLYTKGIIIYFFFGVLLNSLLPVLDYNNCYDRRLSDYYRMHDPCGMPTRIWAPFEVNSTVLYYLEFALYAYSCLNIAYIVLTITMALVGLLIHISAQIRNMKICLLEVFDAPCKAKLSSTCSDIDMENKLKFCVEYHVTVIKYTQEVFEAFSVMLMIHVWLTALILGIICYNIVVVRAFMDKIRYFLQLMGWIGILFLTCFYGQLIINESSSIADAAYQSEWYNGPNHLRRNLCFMIMRAQRPLKLRVANVDISLVTFLSVMKTAYSYFTLLLSISQ